MSFDLMQCTQAGGIPPITGQDIFPASLAHQKAKYRLHASLQLAHKHLILGGFFAYSQADACLYITERCSVLMNILGTEHYWNITGTLNFCNLWDKTVNLCD